MLAAGKNTDIDDEILVSYILRSIRELFNLGFDAVDSENSRALRSEEQSMRDGNKMSK